MKFQEYAHHLFDAVRKRRVVMCMRNVEQEHRARDNLASFVPDLERLPLYVLREPANETLDTGLLEIASERLQQGRIKLPFDRMLVQLTYTDTYDPSDRSRVTPDDVYIVMATREDVMVDTPDQRAFFERVGRGDDAAFWVQIFETSFEELDMWLQPPLLVRVSDGRLHCYQFGDFAGSDEQLDQLSNVVTDAAGYLCAILTLLDSPSVELEAVRIPKEINRGRSLIKKSRIPDHTIIRLPKIAYTSPAGEDQGGTHRRPRSHWRRPHDREFKPGKFTHIPLTLVAKKEGEPPPPPPIVEIVTHRKEPSA